MALVAGDVLGWWNCQEGSGSTTADQSGNSHIGTLGATATWTTGGPTNIPNGILFAGVLSSSNVTVAFDYDVTQGALGVWFNVSALGTTVIAGNGNLGGEFDLFFESGSLKSRSRYTSDQTITSSTTPSTGTTYFVLYNFVSGGMELFLNASSVGTNANTGTLNDTGDNFVWGQRTDGSLLLTGKIFEVMLLNRTLTGAEITALYNAGAGQTYAQAIGGTPAIQTIRNLGLLGVGQ